MVKLFPERYEKIRINPSYAGVKEGGFN